MSMVPVLTNMFLAGGVDSKLTWVADKLAKLLPKITAILVGIGAVFVVWFAVVEGYKNKKYMDAIKHIGVAVVILFLIWAFISMIINMFGDNSSIRSDDLDSFIKAS